MRPVVQLHTIEQWFSVPPEVQQMVLKALKVKDRLWSFILSKEHESKVPFEPHWAPCKRCEQTGWCWKHPRKGGIHPSAMYSTCLLKIYYEAIGTQQQVVHEARQMLVFALGTAVHGMFQSYGIAGAWGDYYVPEVAIGETPLAKSLMIEGHADADNIIVVDEIAGAPIFEVGVVHEYKSINDNGFKGLKGRPKPSHAQQATVYSACLNRPVVVYFYLNKDNSNIEDFPIPFQPHIWDIMQKKAEVVRDAVLAKTPPRGEYGYHCKQCGYENQCPVAAEAKAKKG
jgi:hypothetical protein